MPTDASTLPRSPRPCRDDTILVSVHAANHEVGTVQDIRAIGTACRERGVWFHTDASQALAWLPFDLKGRSDRPALDRRASLLRPEGHRCAVRAPTQAPRTTRPQIHGGGHEQGLRSGTINVPGAVGFGAAAELVKGELDTVPEHVRALRDALETALVGGIPDTRVLGAPDDRLPNNSDVLFEGVEGEAVLVGLPDVALATGSACTSATLEPSHVLAAMGLDKAAANSTVRFSLSRTTTTEEVERTATRVAEVVERLRALGR